MSGRFERFTSGCLAAVLVLFSFGCGQPVLESENCLASRDPVKRLYSLHIDGGANPKGAKLERIRGFLSEGLYKKLSANENGPADYLTQSDKFPKAFRVGTCRDVDSGTEFDVLLFWRTDEISREQKIVVSAVKEDDWVVGSARRLN